jgi:hypothetical protein
VTEKEGGSRKREREMGAEHRQGNKRRWQEDRNGDALTCDM